MEWISVKDRLPEIDGEYIVSGVNVTTFDYYAKIEKWYSDVLDMYINSELITHWMPLPEPPKQ